MAKIKKNKNGGRKRRNSAVRWKKLMSEIHWIQNIKVNPQLITLKGIKLVSPTTFTIC